MFSCTFLNVTDDAVNYYVQYEYYVTWTKNNFKSKLKQK